MISQCAKEGSPGAVAIGVPTVVDEQGKLVPCSNIPTIGGHDVASMLRRDIALPVAIFNDARCCAAGEWWLGAGRGTRQFCCLTLGTGIGLGIVLDGRVVHGHRSFAGEVWTSPLWDGRVEDRLSGAALQADYERRTGERIAPEEIALRAHGGEALALEVFHRFGESLGEVTGWLINILDPETVAYGGSVSNSFALFRESLAQSVQRWTVPPFRTSLVEAELGDRAALLGAARLLSESEDHGAALPDATREKQIS